ncbi:hypothetical protein [Curvibacter fontanus]
MVQPLMIPAARGGAKPYGHDQPRCENQIETLSIQDRGDQDENGQNQYPAVDQAGFAVVVTNCDVEPVTIPQFRTQSGGPDK